MKYFKFYIFLLFFSISIFCNYKDCPNEIQNYFWLIDILGGNDFFRFSQSFFCMAYTKVIISPFGGNKYQKRYLCLFNNTIYEFIDSTNCTNKFDISEKLEG